MDMNEASVKSIYKRKDALLAQLASASPKNTNAVFKTRSRIIENEKMERLITLWIQDLELIKAKSLFDSIKENNIFDPKLTEN